ncbi:carboxypeptidase-like regulatory domain-containing protein [Brumimicrobium mesophilum]|uniref:carboxypeptidase-like regulatory domain-containing protein n=1 Tax=Brumimicrobium mesophilum TaxID=392717 RepID=UPI000D144BFB|nr:carboxypeptidase-like regulatory domain-containing protein [Brumimicrobium mesophilum]
MKTTIKLIAALFFVNFAMGQGSFGDIQGQLFENPEKETPAMFAKVWVERGGSNYGAMTDESGRFKINSIPTGVYVLKVSYNTDSLSQTILAKVVTDGIENLGRINFYEVVNELDEFTVTEYVDPLISFDFGQNRISAIDIEQSAVKMDLKALILSNNSDIKIDADGQMMIRGSRGNDLIHYIDGVKMNEVQSIPSSAIGGVTVYSSAIPAKYGDTTGGVIIMETKSYYDLWRAAKIKESAANF